MGKRSYFSLFELRSLVFVIPPLLSSRLKTRRFLTEFLKKLENKKGSLKVLEIGCGSGYLTKFLARNFNKSEFWALDIEEVVEKLKGRFPPNVHLVSGDFREHEGKYDFVFAQNVFQNFEVSEWVETLIKLTRKDGWFFFTYQRPCSFVSLHSRFLQLFKIPVFPFHPFRLKDLLESYSLDVQTFSISYIEGIYGVLVHKN